MDSDFGTVTSRFAAHGGSTAVPNPDRSNDVDHVVVAILEDRSHDNLVRRLHQA